MFERLGRIVITIAVELHGGRDYKDVIIDLKEKMKKFEPRPFDIKKVEHHHVFDNMGFNSGVNTTLNLVFFDIDSATTAGVALDFPNLKEFLEDIKTHKYKLIAISAPYYFTEYKY